ncbi:hypothetical protein H312_02444 [Anncaliia algerae PRA339]|uniref:Uncharacterized protein n=1 Tax=Anncaliia algerae PRA339 TaxID=1288291 RepID=A0A059EZN2_9MICR|nr:hypothetical protein H312_02444 [Anncaliia algerae PRA339]
MLLIYKSKKQIYCSDKEYIPDDSLFTCINGIVEMSNYFYNDSVFYIENDVGSVNVYHSLTNALLIYISSDRKIINMKHFYKMYSLAVLYGDISVIDQLLKKTDKN